MGTETKEQPTTARFAYRGVEYEIDLTAVNASDARAYRHGTGGEGRLMELMSDMMAGLVDLDMIPALVWLAKRQAGEDVSIGELEAQVDLAEWQHLELLDNDPKL